MSEFDAQEFVNWLDEQPSGVVSENKVAEEFPEFPWDNLPVGLTCQPISEDELGLYKRDLEKAALDIPNLD